MGYIILASCDSELGWFYLKEYGIKLGQSGRYGFIDFGKHL